MASVTSGSAGRKGAQFIGQLAMDQLHSVYPHIEQGWGRARQELRSAYAPSMKYLRQGYERGRKDILGAKKEGTQYLTQGYGDAIDTLNQRYGEATDASQLGVDAWKGNLDRANVGYDMYMDALGLGGETGRADARAAFQAGPGYQWQVDQATSQAQRAANKVGGLYGGNTQAATTRLASNLANQEWGSWLNNLQGFQGAAGQATQGYAGQLNNLAQLYQGQGKDVATMQAAQGKDLSALGQWAGGLNAQYANEFGQNRATMRTGLGQGLASAATGRMQDIIAANNKYYDTVIGTVGPAMQAGQDAAANRMGMLTGGLQLGGKLLGSFFGGGGLFGK